MLRSVKDAIRFSLVLASQCEAMGEGHRLAGLEETARGLDTVLIDPLRGGCVGALTDGQSLLLDPDCAVAEAAVAEAAGRAAAAGGMLVLAWVGHGTELNGDFYVLPRDSVPVPGHLPRPYHLTQHIRELLGSLSGLELLVLVDACMSGDAAAQAAAGWTRLNADARRRFQVLTAANIGELAWDCAFTRAAWGLLRGGDIRAGDRLGLADLKWAAELAGRDQQPVLVSWDGGWGPEMWVARNAALLREGGSLPAFSRQDLPVLRAGLRHYRATPALSHVVRASETHPYVVVRGPAGFGKTTLLGALSRPEVGLGAVPEGFVHGLRLLKLHESGARVAGDLSAQLAATVGGFQAAGEAFQQSVPVVQWVMLPEAERTLLGPLRFLPPGTVVRIALDGFDQLSDTAAADLTSLIDALRSLPSEGAEVRLVVSSRPGAAPPTADTEVELDAATDADIHAYLTAEHIPSTLLDTITAAAQGSWLVASLLAAQANATPGLSADQVPYGLAAIYNQIFDDALDGGATWDQPTSPERALFTVLAAAGPGAVLPTELLVDACTRLGAPQVTSPWLRDGLAARLRRLTVRAPAGDGDASTVQYGLFHQSLADYLARPAAEGGPYAVDVVAGHRAIASAIAALAPADQRTPATARQPLQEYAERAEPDHLWHAGDPTQALGSVRARPSAVPADNLDRFRRWYDEALRLLGPDHPNTLITRGNIAACTGESGDATEALELFTALLPDLVRVFGPEDPATLAARGNIATWTGHTGDAAGALELFIALLRDRSRLLAPDHPDIMITRGNVARWAGQSGDLAEALKLSTALLQDMERVLGPDHPDTLTTRNNIAFMTGELGDSERALDLFTALLPDRIRVLDPDHPDTLTTRNNIALWTGELGDSERALDLFTALLPDRIRVLGPDHPDTLSTRNNIALQIGAIGDAVGALEQFTALLPRMEQVLGPDHPQTLTARNNFAAWRGRAGNEAAASGSSGPDHPHSQNELKDKDSPPEPA